MVRGDKALMLKIMGMKISMNGYSVLSYEIKAVIESELHIPLVPSLENFRHVTSPMKMAVDAKNKIWGTTAATTLDLFLIPSMALQNEYWKLD